MRTQRVLPVQLRVFSAWTIFLRASRFWLGATASSRSRKTWSAFDSEAFCIIFSLEPGVDSWTRRGRLGGRLVIVFSSSYDLVGPQAGNVTRVAADGFQILVGMFAQDGRTMAHLAGGLRHLHGDARDLDFVVETGVRHPRQHVARLEVWVRHDVAHVVDRRERHLAAEIGEQLLLGALARVVGDGRDDDVLVGATILHGDEA